MDAPRPPFLRSYVAHPAHGPLPALLLLLTVGTGIIDAISILGLGRVFVANMTGNVVFIGFALAGAPGYSLSGSLVALVAFLVGATGGGALIAKSATHRGRLLRNSLAVQVVLFVIALIVAVVGPHEIGTARQLVILMLGAFSLGLQNAVVRQLAVPDMTTTVLTMTLTGIGSDLRKRDWATVVRRVIAVLAMLVGALVGALIVLHVGVAVGMLVVVLLLAVALVGAGVASRGTPAWAVKA